MLSTTGKDTYYGEEGGCKAEASEDRDEDSDDVVLIVGEERVLALDAAAFHIQVPAVPVLCRHQRRHTLPRRVELHRFHLVLM